ncbi:MAG: MBOAT family protein [Actinobacteria bacterium]|nr:MBOAT family protein [Actinomycetota bacterium]
MTFNSLQYALFLPVTLALYWSLPHRLRVGRREVPARQLLLLIASYLFYLAGAGWFLAMLLFTTVVDYNVGRALERVERDRPRRWVLGVSLAVNLGALGFFKYSGFFVDQMATLLDRVNLNPGLPILRVALPIGISFYTFQSIAYVVDVYRRDIPACHDAIDFATFVAFFPQLVAGPISRAKSLLPQLQADRPKPNGRQVTSGLLLILVGLVKKVVIADSLAPIAILGFDGRNQGTTVALAGIVAFAFQIYADFSGYTDIARGSARLLNVQLIHNFRQPYFSRSVTEFWRRWHISLSNWLRDYLYVPLGGNRRGTWRTYRNLMLTMLLGGLWHGAGWPFIIWGGLHGLYLSIERARHRQVAESELPGAKQLPAVLATFALVSLAWVFFRSATLADALGVLASVFDVGGAVLSPSDATILVSMVIAAIVIDVLTVRLTYPVDLLLRRPAWSGLAIGMSVTLIVLFSGRTPIPFIYFQF